MSGKIYASESDRIFRYGWPTEGTFHWEGGVLVLCETETATWMYVGAPDGLPAWELVDPPFAPAEAFAGQIIVNMTGLPYDSGRQEGKV